MVNFNCKSQIKIRLNLNLNLCGQTGLFGGLFDSKNLSRASLFMILGLLYFLIRFFCIFLYLTACKLQEDAFDFLEWKLLFFLNWDPELFGRLIVSKFY